MKKNIAATILFVITYLLISLEFYSLKRQVEEFNNTPVEIKISSGISSNEFIRLSMSVSKSWEEPEENKRKMVGAQYDGVIVNTGEYPFRNWTAEIYLPSLGEVDSLWNAEYTV